MEKQDQGTTPQLTFTEQEHKDLIGFLNMMNKGRFDFNLKEAHEAANLHVRVVNLAKKVESHILEIRRVTKAKGE